jgi:DME family drug/metabolite transporter
VCLAGVVWGTIGPAVALVDGRSALSVLSIGAYRAVVAIAVLAGAVFLTGRAAACRSLLRRHPCRTAAVGLLTAAFQLLFFVAVITTGVSVATVVALGVAPVLLLVLGSTRRRRWPSVGHVVTVAAAVAGLLLVGSDAPNTDAAPQAAVGILAAAASGAAYALSAEIGASLTRRHDALAVTTVTMSFAAAALITVGIAPAALDRGSTGTSDGWSWLLIGYLGVVTMAGAYVLLFAGLRTTPSGTAVVATLLEPVTAVLIAVAFLDERLTAVGVVGSLLIVAAIGSLGRRLDPPQPQ